jgi:hypothetical protein
MIRRGQIGIGVVGVALFASQLGHLAAYRLRFGARGTQLGTTGVHGYVPGVTAVAGAAVGGALIASLLLIAISRLLAGRAAGMRARRRVGLVDLLALLFVLQLGCFAIQEMVESLVSGAVIPDALSLLLWGSAGQLPVAVFGALILSWLTARFETALRSLVEGVRGPAAVFGVCPGAALSARPIDLARQLAQASRLAYCKRGPPALRPLLD